MTSKGKQVNVAKKTKRGVDQGRRMLVPPFPKQDPEEDLEKKQFSLMGLLGLTLKNNP
ncbi:hypothetical protein HAX54_049806, partial [Datura stramonium]|nr:hypothetical protein [Datura stramonium]